MGTIKVDFIKEVTPFPEVTFESSPQQVELKLVEKL